MGYQQGLSGLAGASSDLDVIGNNIANSNTVGFKQGAAQFADMYANSVATAVNNQIGIGTRMSEVEQNFSQGTITNDDIALHVAINGNGFFQMSNNGSVTYSRNGVFQLDKNGFIVNADGLKLMGYAANANGIVNTAGTVPLQVPTANIPPTATKGITAGLNLNAQDKLALGTPTAAFAGTNTGTLTNNGVSITDGTQGTNANTYTVSFTSPTAYTVTGSDGSSVSGTYAANSPIKLGNGETITLAGTPAMGDSVTVTPTPLAFDPNNSATYTYSTSVPVYDSLGGKQQVDMYFVKTAAGSWDVYAGKDGSVSTTKVGTANFDTSGNLVSTTTGTPPVPTSTLFAFNFSIPNSDGSATPQNLTLNIAGTTQFGSKDGVNSLTQDGFAAGQLTSFSVGADGTITGNYSNNQTAALGQVALATFANQNGLINLGNNEFQATAASGVAVIAAPGSTNHGVLQGGATENSNVDLTSELVNLITAQRDYQANAQTIKTQQAVDQTLINL
ncbi:flagellar hook protein FlgE [Paraburkholderia hospita]|uniref:flagellar hook protein FlgE n=1 Tax=Paraburkholderia hospita TaxID=169430 RepID=UPI0002718C1B|nr:flagellar hook protein FlgE [Paraburkholderia hospita]EUC21333.1 flagellar hook-basal body protein [Burkholderia sp. BT03]SKC94794.1 flagellar hook protein FlgE [Paraburkholderia hospita]